MSRLHVWPWLRPFLILMAAISIPPLVYWFGYVKSSVEATRRQANVTLSAIATNVKDRLAAHAEIAGHAELKVDEIAKRAPQDHWTDEKIKILQRYLKPLLNTKGEFAPVPANATPSVDNTTTCADNTATSRMHLELGIESAGLLVHVGRLIRKSSAQSNGDCKGECKGNPKGGCTLRNTLSLENLVPWDLVESEFDGLLVLDERDRLLAQDKRLPAQPIGVEVPIQGRSRHLSSSAQPNDAAAKVGTGIDNKTAAAAQSSDLAAKAATVVDMKTARAALNPLDFSRDVTVELAGNEYLVFEQIVRVNVSAVGGNVPTESDRPLSVVVCALLRKDRLRSEAVSLSPQTLVIVGSIAALGLFSIPFLKLRFIGARERLHARDMWLLAGSLMCATALLMLLLMDAYAYRRLLNRFDAALNQFITAALTQIITESDAAAAQLSASAPCLITGRTPGANGSRCSPAPSKQTEIGSILSGPGWFNTIEFESLYTLDVSGKQTYKWMSRTVPTAHSNLGDREYFLRALTLSDQSAGASNYFFDSVISRTTGSQVSVHSIPYEDTRRSSPAALQTSDAVPLLGVVTTLEKRRGVLAITTPMRSVSEALVPQPFQFLLVGRDGTVTFHHAQGPFTGERFFQTVRGGTALQQAAHDTALLDINDHPRSYRYRRHVYRMRSIYVPALDSTLVAYYDEAIISQVVARTFSTAAIMIFGIVVAILGGAVLTMVWRGHKALDWAWPTASRDGVYVLGCVACVVYFLLLWVVRD